jgi:hypothetical protein
MGLGSPILVLQHSTTQTERMTTFREGVQLACCQ